MTRRGSDTTEEETPLSATPAVKRIMKTRTQSESSGGRGSSMGRSFRDRTGSNAKNFFMPNMNLLPLKFTLFFFNGASFAVMPYLTIHMKDIGINDVDIALMYAILPFCVFIAPPLVGFFADKLGNYVRVLVMSIIACAIFHTLLLAVPTMNKQVDYPDTKMTMQASKVTLEWEKCIEETKCSKIRNPAEKDKDPVPIYFEMNDCELACSNEKITDMMMAAAYTGIALTYESMVCGQINSLSGTNKHCKVWPGQKKMEFIRVNTNVTGNDDCGQAQIEFFTDSDPCITNDLEDEIRLGIKDDCTLNCEVRTNLVRRCGDSNHGNRLITNGVYFIFRMLATMALASCFILLDAQTIQMCTVEEKRGHTGSYGRQILYKTLAQAIISPSVGLIMDYITEMQGQPNYVAAFIIADILIGMSLFCALKIDMDLELPKSNDAMGGLKAILTNVEILLFLIMMFVCGSMYGFVETFLFVFLKEDLHAPMYLLGLTITTGAVVSLPFLYYSDTVVKKLGVWLCMVWTLLMYGVRYIGYSYLDCAWYAFPFEALEIFTYSLPQVATAHFIKKHSKPGTLATLTGIAGGAHTGFGKGVGGLAGGIIIEVTKNTKMAFYYFGLYSFGCGGFVLIIMVLVKIFMRKTKKKTVTQVAESGEEKEEPFLSIRHDGDGGEIKNKPTKVPKVVLEDELQNEMVVHSVST